jgi:predicted transcriptional regulator
MTRRPDGALETDVMHVLWAANAPVAPADVRAALDVDLAYTSVATVLNRLCDKGLASREPDGRKFVYVATSTEADLTGQRINSLLEAANDREAALAGFLKNLSADDAQVLRSLLDESG